MKKRIRFLMLLIVVVIVSCNKKLYSTNGETIYKTGRNLKGEKLLDKQASRLTIINSCKTCHGKNGDAMRRTSIKFSDLSDSKKYSVPYTDALFYRFLDDDLKSNGYKANIGVIWKMTDDDKKALLDYLKTL